MVLIVLIRIQGLPEWLMPSLGALLLFLCLLTMFFLAQQTIGSLRRRRSKSRDWTRSHKTLYWDGWRNISISLIIGSMS